MSAFMSIILRCEVHMSQLRSQTLFNK
jgi:hypothetical protein